MGLMPDLWVWVSALFFVGGGIGLIGLYPIGKQPTSDRRSSRCFGRLNTGKQATSSDNRAKRQV